MEKETNEGKSKHVQICMGENESSSLGACDMTQKTGSATCERWTCAVGGPLWRSDYWP